MKSSASESKPFQSSSRGEIPGQARRKELLSPSKLKQAAKLEGKSFPFNMAANTNHTTLLKNQSVIKYLLKCVSSQIPDVR